MDPECTLDPDTHHVLESGGVTYSETLNRTDVTAGANSFYVLQILVRRSGPGAHLFRRWGRVGTSIGDSRLERMGVEEAVQEFKRVFREKTGNTYSAGRAFEKVPGFFYPLEIEYGGDSGAAGGSTVEPGSTSALPLPVQQLMRMLFDVSRIERALVEMEIDLEKMPLGQLSKRAIRNAYSILTELQVREREKRVVGGCMRLCLARLLILLPSPPLSPPSPRAGYHSAAGDALGCRLCACRRRCSGSGRGGGRGGGRGCGGRVEARTRPQAQ